MGAADDRRGVRGPRGPQQPSPQGKPAGKATGKPSGTPTPRSDLSGFQRASLPLLTRLSRLPKWALVVVLAVLLVLGMIQTGSLAWLGALILGLLAAFFAWLLVLSWPVIPPSGRLLRGLVVLALAGVAVLKLLGRI